MSVQTSGGGVEAGATGLVPLWLDGDRSEVLSVQVSNRLVRALDGRARLNGRSRASEIRLALGVWLEGGGSPQTRE